jgi:hypothetical protein
MRNYKIIASDFTTLLQKIVLTIDKYGLKKYFLISIRKELMLLLIV